MNRIVGRRNGDGKNRRRGSRAAATAMSFALALTASVPVHSAPWLVPWLIAVPAVVGTVSLGSSVMKHGGEMMDRFEGMFDAAFEGDNEEVKRQGKELKKVMGRIVRDTAFPIISVTEKVAGGTVNAVKSLGERFSQGAERAREGLSVAKRKAADMAARGRSALAVGDSERKLLGDEPLPQVAPAQVVRPVTAPTQDAWGEWKKQEQAWAEWSAGHQAGGDERLKQLEAREAALLDRYEKAVGVVDVGSYRNELERIERQKAEEERLARLRAKEEERVRQARLRTEEEERERARLARLAEEEEEEERERARQARLDAEERANRNRYFRNLAIGLSNSAINTMNTLQNQANQQAAQRRAWERQEAERQARRREAEQRAWERQEAERRAREEAQRRERERQVAEQRAREEAQRRAWERQEAERRAQAGIWRGGLVIKRGTGPHGMDCPKNYDLGWSSEHDNDSSILAGLVCKKKCKEGYIYRYGKCLLPHRRSG